MPNDNLRERLTAKLIRQRTSLKAMDDLYEGRAPLSYLDKSAIDLYGNRVMPLPVNLPRLAIDVLTQRLRVTGFRSSVGDPVDNDLLALWRSTGLDASSLLVHTDALVLGAGYFLCWAVDGEPVVTPESPFQVAVERDPVRRSIVAACKRWRDPVSGHAHTVVLTADTVEEWISKGVTSDLGDGFRAEPVLAMGEDVDLVRSEPNPLGVVPVVALVNRPRVIQPDGVSELADIDPLARAIAKLGADMMVASEATAVPRRWLSHPGEIEAEQAKALRDRVQESMLRAGVSVLSGGGEMHQIDGADLDNFETSITLLVNLSAALAALPGYYVSASTANPTSADAIRAAESRLSARARERQQWWGPAYADLMRLVVLVRDGQVPADYADLETLWADVEPTTLAQTADAASKLYATGITDRRAALESTGATPLEVERQLDAPPSPENSTTRQIRSRQSEGAPA